MLESQNPQEGADRSAAGRDAGRPANGAPLADREVPLPGSEAFGTTPAAVHAWLDGEASEADARLADARQVALWSRIETETAQRRRMTTPAYVQQRIMDALPQATPTMATATATATAAAATATTTAFTIVMSPVSAMLAAAGLIAAGFLLARFVA
jgi:hypothetical protein